MIDLDAAATRAIDALGRKSTAKDRKILHASIKGQLKLAFEEGFRIGQRRPRMLDVISQNWLSVPTTARFVEYLTVKVWVLKEDGTPF